MARTLALPLVLGLLASGCGTGLVGGRDGADGASPAQDGWVSLFDGETLDGWRGYDGAPPPSSWSVEDGALAFTPGSGEGGDLLVDGTYGDFELELEWKVAACGNSGIFYWVEEASGIDGAWRTGLEMQVLDDACHPDAEFPSHRAGALYDLYVPTAEAVRPAGEWNRVRIVAREGHLEHWLNGEKIVEAEPGSEDWRARLAVSKFRDGAEFPAFGTRRRGAIGLQDHGDAVWYRNVRIRPL